MSISSNERIAVATVFGTVAAILTATSVVISQSPLFETPTLICGVSLSLLCSGITLAWAAILYQLISAAVRVYVLSRQRDIWLPRDIEERIGAAILLCTRDDWVEDTAIACLQAMGCQDYLYICDDSQSAHFKQKVTDFAKNHDHICRVVRRPSLKGYKAGNLNNCIAQMDRRYDYICIVDHDNLIHPATLDRGVRILETDRDIPFVQFSLRTATRDRVGFQRWIDLSCEIMWWVQIIRGRFGLPTCCGHSVVFRVTMVTEVGGFPETLTEDLAITLKFLAHGWLGHYDDKLTCMESLPGNYSRFRARHVRWSIGTVQSWLRRDIFRVHNASWLLVDGSLQALTLLYPIPTTLVAFGWSFYSAYAVGADRLWEGVVTVTAIMTIVSSFVPIILNARNSRQAIRNLIFLPLLYLSLIVPTIIAIFIWAVGGPTVYNNTGNQTDVDQEKASGIFGPNGYIIRAGEVSLALWIIVHLGVVGPLGILILIGCCSGICLGLASNRTKLRDSAFHASGGARGR
jgi:cellulose synthase/poly-beta-1,6-N-acetylglucosamine synthase-like glycosyltransferase